MVHDDKALQARIEELIKEELDNMGEAGNSLTPEQIAASLRCEVHEGSNSYTYYWKDFPVLRVVEEKDNTGHVLRWRFFTQENYSSN